MKIHEIINCDPQKLDWHRLESEFADEMNLKNLIPIMYGDNELAKEKLELEKLRAEIDAIEAQAALHRAEASRS